MIQNNNNNNQQKQTTPTTTNSNTNPTNNNGSTTSTAKPIKNVIWGSRSVDIFEKIEQVGEGTYGKVYLAKSKENGEYVALKKIRMDNEKEGFPITAIREIKILKELRHQNIISLKEIVTSKATKENRGESSIYMVFEYMDHDLTGLMMSDNNLWCPTPAHIKCYMKQLLEGIHHCHSNGVLHRDIKGSNLLLDNKGHLKLADFGLARPFSEHVNNYTNRVITLWYRPPELLLGAVQYSTAIDMWSVGCILAELLAKRAIFPGRNEIDQLELIYKICGTPTEENWPDIVNLPLYKTFKPQKLYRRSVRDIFKNFPVEALDLIDKLLTLDPKKRISASEALDSEYFWSEPLPCNPSDIPTYPTSHEFQAKKRRAHLQQSVEVMKRQRTGPPVPPNGNPNPPNPNVKFNGGNPPPPYGSHGGSHGGHHGHQQNPNAYAYRSQPPNGPPMNGSNQPYSNYGRQPNTNQPPTSYGSNPLHKPPQPNYPPNQPYHHGSHGSHGGQPPPPPNNRPPNWSGPYGQQPNSNPNNPNYKQGFVPPPPPSSSGSTHHHSNANRM